MKIIKYKPGLHSLIRLWAVLAVGFNFLAYIVTDRMDSVRLDFFILLNCVIFLAAVAVWITTRKLQSVILTADRVSGPRYRPGQLPKRITLKLEEVIHVVQMESPLFLPRFLRHRYMVISDQNGRQILLDPFILGNKKTENIIRKLRHIPIATAPKKSKRLAFLKLQKDK